MSGLISAPNGQEHAASSNNTQPRSVAGSSSVTSVDRKNLPVYAQDTLKEVLGWYGLQEATGSGGVTPKEDDKTPNNVASTPTTPSTCGSSMSVDEDKDTTPKCASPRPMEEGSGPLDLTSSGGLPTNSTPDSLATSSGGSRRLVGMRFLFPPLPEDMSLLDKARVWVARHEHKYFVGWSSDQLQYVEPLLRPINVITPAAYKLNMNRSEYCRNVKLKYCLESDAPWAQEFRLKLSKPPSQAGFTGLCQAKIAAAELWRKYSENYRSHQARYPNPKSRYKGQWGSRLEAKRSTSDDEEDGLKRVKVEEEYDRQSPEVQDGLRVREDESREQWQGDVHPRHMQKAVWKSGVKVDPYMTVHSVKEANNNETLKKGRFEDGMCSGNSSLSGAYYPSLMPYSVALQMYQASLQPDPRNTTTPSTSTPRSSVNSQPKPSLSPPVTSANLSLSDKEYKRSERGLSFLFPSLSDHNLSLLEKVHITVQRHKNNYFLGWSESELGQLDSYVRPKMVVNTDIYKEYCHRNAMKYDSNLQFAMESQEIWAQEFRDKLTKPPSEGGFSSLCEVKLEAGRLWREYSGKYRMHNIVKWQMDLNSTSTSPTTQSAPIIKQELPDDQSPHKTTLSLWPNSPASPSPGASQPLKHISPPFKPESSNVTPVSEGQSEAPQHATRSEPSDSVTSYPQQLFTPLSPDLSVSQQLYIWLERHKRHYFLGYTKEELSSQVEYLRPQCAVTLDVLKKYIPDNMVDVLNKVQLIMSSSTAWALHFQDRVHKSKADGGFSSFEEALTEAVILWHAHWMNDKSAKETLTNGHHSDEGSSETQETQWPPNQSSPVDDTPKNEENDTPVENHTTNGYELPVSKEATPSASNVHRDLSVNLWQARAELQRLCGEDTCRSWSQRLHNFQDILHEHVGPDYELPSATNTCIVDLVLCYLQSHIDSRLEKS